MKFEGGARNKQPNGLARQILVDFLSGENCIILD